MNDDTMAPSKGSSDETSKVNEEDGRVGLSGQSDEAIVKQCLEWWKDSADRGGDRSKSRTRAHKMYDGDHWEKADREKRKSRPTLSPNLLISIIAAVEGQEKNNRQEIKFYGRGGEDDRQAERWNKLFKWVVENNEGDFEQSRQFKEMLISGEGWIEPYVDYLDDPEGTLCLEYVDNDEVFDDPYSTHPVGTDARRRQRVLMLTVDEGEAMFPGKFETSIKMSMLSNEISETDGRGYPDIYLTPDQPNGLKRYDAKDKTWAVIKTYWWEVVSGWVVLNEQTGIMEEATDEEFEEKKAEREAEQQQVLQMVMMGQAVLAQPDQPPPPMMDPSGMMQAPPVTMPPSLKAQKRPIKRVYESYVVFDKLLDHGPIAEKTKHFPLTPLRGIYRKSKKDWIGLIEPLIDLVKQHAVEQSILVELMLLMPKSSWMGPKGSFHNKVDWENGVAQPGKLLEYNAQRGKPEPISPPPIPRHLMELAFSRPQAMREVSGVNVEMTGIRQGSDAGVVMEQRAKAAQTVLAPLFDNARRTKKVLGKILLAFMQEHLSVGRQIRILGPEGAELIEVDQDMLAGRYDLAVDEANQTVNDRIATLNLMQTTLPTMVDKGIPIPPSIVDLLPMNTKIRDEWKNMIHWQLQQTGGLPPPNWKAGDPIPPPAAPPMGAPPVEPQPT